MATEGYQSSGSSNITVSEGSGGGNPTTPTDHRQPGGSGNCTATISAGQQWGDRFNLNVAVSGTSNWVVSLGLGGGQSIQNSWNASVSGNSGTVTATTERQRQQLRRNDHGQRQLELADGHLPNQLTPTNS